MGGRWLARFADNFSFIHGLFLKCGAAIQKNPLSARQIDVCRSDKITNYELRIGNCQLREPCGSPLYIK